MKIGMAYLKGISIERDFDRKVLQWYERALAIREKAHGKEHPDTAAFYNNIVNVYKKQGVQK